MATRVGNRPADSTMKPKRHGEHTMSNEPIVFDPCCFCAQEIQATSTDPCTVQGPCSDDANLSVTLPHCVTSASQYVSDRAPRPQTSGLSQLQPVTIRILEHRNVPPTGTPALRCQTTHHATSVPRTPSGNPQSRPTETYMTLFSMGDVVAHTGEKGSRVHDGRRFGLAPP